MKVQPAIKGFVYEKKMKLKCKPLKTREEKFFYFNFFTTGITQL